MSLGVLSEERVVGVPVEVKLLDVLGLRRLFALGKLFVPEGNVLERLRSTCVPGGNECFSNWHK